MRPIPALRTLFLALLVSVVPASSFAGIFLSVNIAPPVLPVYVQPVCPGDGYLWTPGYWAYGMPATSGFLEPGCWRHALEFSGPLATGAGVAVFTSGMPVIGDPTLASTVE